MLNYKKVLEWNRFINILLQIKFFILDLLDFKKGIGVFFIKNINFKFYEYLFFLILIFGYFVELFFVIDFCTLYLYIEIFNFLLCLLLLFSRLKNNFSLSWYILHVVVKYFFFSIIFSVFFILGSFLLYGYSGSFFFENILFFFFFEQHFDLSIILSLCFLLNFFFFKLGSAPFHFGIIEVYEIANYFVLIIFSILSKLVYIYGICFFLFILFVKVFFYVQLFLIFFAMLSLIFGTLSGLLQLEIKSLLGFSGLFNIGLFLFSLCFKNILVFLSLVFNYFIYLGILFILIIYLNFFAKGQSSLSFYNETLNNEFIFNIYFGINCSLLFSISGLPPFSGFFAKYYLFNHFLEFDYYGLFIFFIILLLFLTIFSTIYYFRLIKQNFNFYLYQFYFKKSYKIIFIKNNFFFGGGLLLIFFFLIIFFLNSMLNLFIFSTEGLLF